MNADSSEVLEEINTLFDKFMKSRGYFPYMDENMVGAREFQTAPIYRRPDMNITFVLDRPITKGDIETNNEIGGLLNQNVIIRLCALLEEYGIIISQQEVDYTIDEVVYRVFCKFLAPYPHPFTPRS